MADLTQAMGLNPSRIYAAFGDKYALFQLAFLTGGLAKSRFFWHKHSFHTMFQPERERPLL